MSSSKRYLLKSPRSFVFILLLLAVFSKRLAVAQIKVDAPETVQIDKAAILQAQGKHNEAENLLLNVLDAKPGSIQALNMLGQIFLKENRYHDAMARFETVLAVHPKDVQARDGEQKAAVALALDSKRKGDGMAALQALIHARDFLPDDPILLTDLGIQAESVHQLTVASTALNAALSLIPENPTTLYALARTEVDQEHFGEAEKHFRAYLALHPNDSSAYYGLGHLLQMQLKNDDAKVQFQHSITLQPIQTESYFQLGQIALDSGDNEEARQMFEKTLSRMSTHGGALTGLGILAYRTKQFEAARSALLQAVSTSPDYQPAHYYLGLTLGRLGEKDPSENELQKAKELAAQQQDKGKPVATIQ